ncbi:MAG: molybdopterin molybdotransferase MoeA [Acidobacteria bacterium]|nr:molybdopterin molybdotransferase MoeA [Acidobacteriota bacterium]MCA1643103.1 molybdopterin molybdotransferase MoeA [Acidobacteriota bacterium]
MLPVTEAIRIVEEQTQRLDAESVALREARGRVLAEDVIADTDLPPFDRALMDGYAVRAEDTEGAPATLRLVGEAAAGRSWRGELKAGEAVRIMTGAPVPAGADSVQQVELTRETQAGATVEIDKATAPGQFVTRRATEIKKGETVLRAGERVSPAMLAALASFGYARARVGARPRVAVLATGSELVRVEDEPGDAQLRDSNTYSLLGYAEAAGATVEPMPFAADDEGLLRRLIRDAAERSDALVLSGGVSMGVYDFTKSALHALGAEIFFDRVSLRPGKPTVFARLANARRTLVFGLPGNPVSVSVTFNLFARTALLAMQGATGTRLAEHHAVLARDAKGSMERASYLPATLRSDERGRIIAEPLKWGGSSDFVAFTRAGALIVVPEGTRTIAAGSVVSVLRLPD